MTSNIVTLTQPYKDATNIPECLRSIAAAVEAGILPTDGGVTILFRSRVCHLGTGDKQHALEQAIVNIALARVATVMEMI